MKILFDKYLSEYKKRLTEAPDILMQKMEQKKINVDYFHFYNSVSSVYSSKIEGEEIDFDSFYKHKFMKIKFKPDYTQKADDLFSAYEFILNNKISGENILIAHKIISKNLLPKSQQGFIRTNLMFVLNNNDEIEYVAAEPAIVKNEIEKLFSDIEKWFLLEKLGKKAINIPSEKFYYNSITNYYSNIKKLGLEYEELNYDNCIDFLLMIVSSLKN